MPAPREIDWSTAVVEDGALSVELTGEPSGTWSSHMEGVIARLEKGRWGAIKVGRRRVRVASVAEDSVEEVRHLLEAAALQTNADLVAAPADEAGGPSAAMDGPDRELTDAFRGFAPGGRD